MDPARRSALLAAKLGALVRDRWGDGAVGDPRPFPGGAGLVAGDRGFVLADEQPARALGGALVWGWRNDVADLHVLVDPGPEGLLARRAAGFSSPATVWRVDGRALVAAEPAPLTDDEPVPELSFAYENEIRAGGAVPVPEHGVLRAEVLGLEVGRVIGEELLVGVGRHDREAHIELGDAAGTRTLAEAVAAVREHRRPDAPAHPANQLGRERWLRAVVVDHPELVGADELRPVAPPLPRADLRQPSPAPAIGAGVLVVCSTGVDLDLAPSTVDLRLRHGADLRTVLVLPEGDDLPAIRHLAGRLDPPAEVRTVAKTWEALTA